MKGFYLFLFGLALAPQTPYDLVIRGGRVLDGAGNPWVRADLAIRGDRIAAIGQLGDLPAARLRLSDRGILRPGMAADVVVFDPERVIDRATFDEPHRYAEGIDVVIVNGQVVLDEGRHTGATPGRVLRGPGYRSAASRTN